MSIVDFFLISFAHGSLRNNLFVLSGEFEDILRLKNKIETILHNEDDTRDDIKTWEMFGVPYLHPNQSGDNPERAKIGILHPETFTRNKTRIFTKVYKLFNQTIFALQKFMGVETEIFKPEVNQNEPEVNTKKPKINGIRSEVKKTEPEVSTIKQEVRKNDSEVDKNEPEVSNKIFEDNLDWEDITLICLIVGVSITLLLLIPVCVKKYYEKPKKTPYEAFENEEDLNLAPISTNSQYFTLENEDEGTLIRAPKYIVANQENAVLL